MIRFYSYHYCNCKRIRCCHHHLHPCFRRWSKGIPCLSTLIGSFTTSASTTNHHFDETTPPVVDGENDGHFPRRDSPSPTQRGGERQQQQQQRKRGLSYHYDPSTRRPNQKCDPYGQRGKPLSQKEAEQFMNHLQPQWSLIVTPPSPPPSPPTLAPLTQTPTSDHTSTKEEDEQSNTLENSASRIIIYPYALSREYQHPDYLSGARFLERVAAVAMIQRHFPDWVGLERRIIRKQWHTYTRIDCRTEVLGGLSAHDFQLAMMIDVEAERPDARHLIVQNDIKEK